MSWRSRVHRNNDLFLACKLLLPKFVAFQLEVDLLIGTGSIQLSLVCVSLFFSTSPFTIIPHKSLTSQYITPTKAKDQNLQNCIIKRSLASLFTLFENYPKPDLFLLPQVLYFHQEVYITTKKFAQLCLRHKG